MEVEATRNINGVKVVIKSNGRELLIPDITAEEINKIRELFPGYYFSDSEIKDWILEKYMEDTEDWDE